MHAASLVSLLLSASPADPYVGTQAVRVEITDHEQAQLVEQLSMRLLDERVGGRALDVVVDAAGLDALAAAGFDIRVLEPDLHARIVSEQERIAAAQVPRDFDGWFEDFKTLEQIEDHVDELAALAPGRIEVSEIGTSLEGRPIRVVRLGDGDPDKPAIVVTGVQHAREWLASMVPVCVIDRFARDGETDPTIAAILDRATVYVIPIVNPDGFVYTWADDRYWRKNRRDGHGVDLNRNWSAGWGKEMGSSPDLDSDQYHGDEAFSEPETRAVRDFVQSHPEVEALIDFHAFAGVVASSYAHTDDPPEDIDLLRAWGDGLADQINETHDYGYRSLHGEDANHTIGYAAGTEPDWAHDAGIHGFTIELRPRFDDEGGGGFEVPPETIIPTCEENSAAVLDLARWASSSDEAFVEIATPTDGTFFADAPALTEIELDVDFAGPLSRVNMYINGELQTWSDTVFPHEAEIDFPRGTWELVAEVETWDGQVSVSAPVTVYVGDEPPDGGSEGGTGEGGTGEGGSGETGSGDTDGDDAAQDALDTRGCGCASPRPGPGGGLLLLALAVWRRRR